MIKITTLLSALYVSAVTQSDSIQEEKDYLNIPDWLRPSWLKGKDGRGNSKSNQLELGIDERGVTDGTFVDPQNLLHTSHQPLQETLDLDDDEYDIDYLELMANIDLNLDPADIFERIFWPHMTQDPKWSPIYKKWSGGHIINARNAKKFAAESDFRKAYPFVRCFRSNEFGTLAVFKGLNGASKTMFFETDLNIEKCIGHSVGDLKAKLKDFYKQVSMSKTV